MRQRYLRTGLAVYSAWVAVFILEGLYAVTLPTADPTLRIDTLIPVVPEFVWVYVSCYVFPLILLIITRDWHRFNLALLAIMICTLLAFIGHLAYPVAFERPQLDSSLSARFVAFIYAHDFKPGAQNFPSLHVAIAWIVAFASRGNHLGRIVELGIFLYAILIMLSTVFIKQHLVVDLVGGTFLAFAVWPLLRRVYDRRILPEEDPHTALCSMFGALAPFVVFCCACLVLVIAGHELR
jgi:membrane-associated phospholipid phosphatase